MKKSNKEIQEFLQTIQMIKDIFEVDGHSALDIYKMFEQNESN